MDIRFWDLKKNESSFRKLLILFYKRLILFFKDSYLFQEFTEECEVSDFGSRNIS